MKNKKKIVKIILICLFLLLFTRFFDFYFFWNIGNGYFLNKDSLSSKKVLFIKGGFYSKNKAKNELKKKLNEDSKIVFISYFTFFSPFKLLVYSKEENKAIDLPYIGGAFLEKGFNEITIYKPELVKIKNEKKVFYYVHPVVGNIFSNMYVHGLFSKSSTFSRIELDWGNEDIIFQYFLYFYFPLLLILVFYFLFKKRILFSFLYYIEMIILFDLSSFIQGAFLIFDKMNLFISIRNFSGYIGAAFFIVLMLVSILLIKKGKTFFKSGLSDIEKLLIIYFISLPIFLRF
jgi:hypothetical protein